MSKTALAILDFCINVMKYLFFGQKLTFSTDYFNCKWSRLKFPQHFDNRKLNVQR